MVDLNKLEHDNNVLANENILLQGDNERMERELRTELARVRVLRGLWERTLRDLVDVDKELETMNDINDALTLQVKTAELKADRFEHALNVANQGLENVLLEANGTDSTDRLDNMMCNPDFQDWV